MKAVFLNVVYAVLLAAVSPVVLWRAVRYGRYRRGLRQKLLGDLPVFAADESVIWFHAVSVGEVLQLETLVPQLRQRLSADTRVLITTSTDTGFDQAGQRYPDCVISWFPLDFSWAVKRALAQVRPTMVVLVELELWPGFLDACRKQDVDVALINARLSERSFRGYRRLGRLIRPSLAGISVIAAQDEATQRRLTSLGTTAARTFCTGSIKFDRVITDRNNPDTRKLGQVLGLDSAGPVLVVGSSQVEEETAVLAALPNLRRRYPMLRTIIVPRHPQRFDAVADAIKSAGFALLRRSQLENHQSSAPDAVILLDTLGELSHCWGLADIALVGGSFGSRGGQNMIEPAAFGAAVTFGPNTRNFADVVRLLKAADACRQIDSLAEVEATLMNLLDDPDARRRLGRNASAEAARHCGASEKTIELLTGLLRGAALQISPEADAGQLPLAG